MAKVRDDFRSLTGAEKAALLVLTLNEDNAAKILGKMHEDEIREISQAMANLGAIHASLVERMCQEFAEQLSSSGGLVGSFDATERLLSKTLPKDRVAALMEEIRGPAGRTMWDKLGNVNEAVLAAFLKNEYPQTVALVLSKINPPHAGRVLAQLPESFSMEVVMRMLRMESVQKDVIEGVERTLRNEFMSNLARTSRRDAHEVMAEIFNSFDRANEARFVTALEERDREAAEKIKKLMFTFDDLKRIDAAGLQTLLRTVEKDKLVLALKGSTDAMRDLFFKSMSDRAAKLLKEDIEALGPVRLRDVDDAQAAVCQAAKTLAQSGQIQISDGKEDELVY